MTRFIGRPERLLSPINVLLKSNEAKSPDKSLIDVPELPQSSADAGAWSFFGAVRISVRSSIKSALQPNCLIISSVARQSAPKEKFEILILPPVCAPKIRLLWEIDLSGGMVISPKSLPVCFLLI